MPLRSDELRLHRESLEAIMAGRKPAELAIIPSNLMFRTTPDVVLVTGRAKSRAGDVAIIMRWAAGAWQGARTVAARHLSTVPDNHPDLATARATLPQVAAEAA